ncbi:MAG: Alanine-tRNA ligase [Parcubacteria group bacterium GW2011_GWB1_52_7]|nr:MAG: Alanine-tRNA ligase [Parcubacteria group bacterium GW2011_GWB1_52_7]
MEADKIRNKFLKFFKDRGHAVVSSSSLIPDDPSVLLTTAGMQQFKPYYTGEADPIKDFNSKNTVSIQKSFRTSDIDEVGDETHLTFFEMLGNFSFGGYFKEDAIKWAHEFITKEMGLAISYVSIFRGSDSVPKDEESRAIWQGLGISDIREEGMADVFWGPTGSSGPCGPTTEIYCKDATGQDVEIWNIVFNQFYFPGPREELLSGASGKKLEPLKIPGVDTGMGLERLAMISQGKKNIFETDLFAPLVGFLPKPLGEEKKRIAADHLRGTTFLLADGVRPSNKGAGYILRRLMRRAFAYEHIFKIPSLALDAMAHGIIHQYGEFYPELVRGSQSIMAEITAERSRFSKTLDRGLRELEKMNSVGAVGAFKLYETFGLPYEIIKEVADSRAMNLSREDFDKEFERHQAISRAGVEKKFGGHGLILDTGELKAGSEEELKIVTLA